MTMAKHICVLCMQFMCEYVNICIHKFVLYIIIYDHDMMEKYRNIPVKMIYMMRKCWRANWGKGDREWKVKQKQKI